MGVWDPELRDRALFKRYFLEDHWKRIRWLKLAVRPWCDCGEPSTHVHHKTYKRLFRERLEDLDALCARCHLYLHGRSTFN